MSNFIINLGDLTKILEQIKVAERHAAGENLVDIIGPDSSLLPVGLRTVDGSYNNLLPGQSQSGAADTTFPRLLTPVYGNDQDGDQMAFGPPGSGAPVITNTNYDPFYAGPNPNTPANRFSVADADPRIISNLIADQTASNPAALAAALIAAGSTNVVADVTAILEARAATADAFASIPGLQVALQTAQANLAAGSNGPAIAAAQAALAAAQSAVANANAGVVTANNNLAAAQAAQVLTAGALTTAQSQASSAAMALAAASTTYNAEISSTIDTAEEIAAQQTYLQAQANNAAAQAALPALVLANNNALSSLASAQSAVNTAQALLNTETNELGAANLAVSDANAAFNTASTNASALFDVWQLAILDEAAKLDALNDAILNGGDVVAAQAAYDQATLDTAAAETAYTAGSNSLVALQTAIDDTTAAAVVAQTEYDAASTALTDAIVIRDDAQSAQTGTQLSLNAANATAASTASALSTATVNFLRATSTTVDSPAEIAAQNAFNTSITSFTAAQAAVNNAATHDAAAINNINTEISDVAAANQLVVVASSQQDVAEANLADAIADGAAGDLILTGLVETAQGNLDAAVAATTAYTDLIASSGLTIAADGTINIEHHSPDIGLSPANSGWMMLFGQFFDHGLDLVTKGGNGTVYIPLQPDDPNYVEGSSTNFMALTRAKMIPVTQPDGSVIMQAENTTTAFVDQNQTYTSHASHQVFLREYEMRDGKPVATGHLLSNANGGISTWGDVKAQAANMLGIELTDMDIHNVPLLRTDPYGAFIRGPNGFAQVIVGLGDDGIPNTADDIVIEGDPTAPISLPPTTLRTAHAFLNDIAHDAAPAAGLVADADTDLGTSLDGQAAGTYDNELLDSHFITGDGRGNENIGLSAVHFIFHAEHDRAVDVDKLTILRSGDINVIKEWLADHNTTELPGLPPAGTPDDVLAAYADTLAWDGERLFQAARFSTEMQYQHMVFEEFARRVQPNIDPFVFTNTADLDPAIVAEFAHAIYRFGHSQLNATVDRLENDLTTVNGDADQISLVEAFLNPAAFHASSGDVANATSDFDAAANIIRGMSIQVGQEIDEFVGDSVRNFLVGLPLDLAALNIARGRDTGVPGLNEARRQLFDGSGHPDVTPYTSWLDFAQHLKNPLSVVNFIAAYGTHQTIADATTLEGKRDAAWALVFGGAGAPADRTSFLNATGNYAGGSLGGLESVDLWIGGLAEELNEFGGQLGSTFNFVFEYQLEHLQNGDRFYYLSRTQGMNLLNQLEGNTFSDIIMRNTNLGNLHSTHLVAEIMEVPDHILELDTLVAQADYNGAEPGIDPTHGDAFLDAIDPKVVREQGTLRVDSNGDAVLDAEGQQIFDGGILKFSGGEHVVLGGTEGNDILLGDKGIDTLWGDGGDDYLNAGMESDQVFGGDGDDIIEDPFGDDFLRGEAGNDVIVNGAGLDILFGGSGNDFIMAVTDTTEVFAGEGNDWILGGTAPDALLGNEGDDWIEGGEGFDGLSGENSELFFNSAIVGHDILNGQGNDTDYDGENGDDIMFQGAGIQRNNGMEGFDWAIHKGDAVAADSDLGLKNFLTAAPLILRDRFDSVEGLSGWKMDDVLTGSSAAILQNTNFFGGLTKEGADRIAGLQAVIGPEPLNAVASTIVFGAGNLAGSSDGEIILGGAGSDVIKGNLGNDALDGDAWLNVRISIHANKDGSGPEIATVDTLTSVIAAGAGVPAEWVGKQLQALMRSGDINPGQLEAVREILSDSKSTDGLTEANDVAVFNEVRANYTITSNGDGSFTVSHVTVTDPKLDDGIDRIRNFETLRFADGDIGINLPATGAPVMSDLTPTEGQAITLDTLAIQDVDGLGPFSIEWQSSPTAGGVFTSIAGATNANFTPGQAQVGQFLRAVVTFQDGLGNSETVISAVSTRMVGDLIVNGIGNLVGNAGDDNLGGGIGANTLTGNAGDDLLNGGGGTDTAVFAAGINGVTFGFDGAGQLQVNSVEGFDTLNSIENLNLGGSNYTLNFGTDLNNNISGGIGNNAMFGQGGDDNLTYGVTPLINLSGRDFIDGGANASAAGDRFILNGTLGAETFRVYSRAAFLAVAGNATAPINANSEIIVTRNGTNNASIIAELDNIEEITINAAGITVPGIPANAGGDVIQVIGDFTGTSLNFNTITVNTADGGDVIDLSRQTSTHHVVVNSDGGNDTFVGGAAIADVNVGANGWLGYSNSTTGVTVDLNGESTGGLADNDTTVGFQHIDGSNYDDSLIGNDLANVITGHGGNDALVGNGGNDNLRAGAGEDSLDGGEGDDILVGGSGADEMIGGTGFDTAWFYNTTTSLDINLATGIGSGGDAEGDTYSSIERVYGSHAADTITGDGEVNHLYGYGGNDNLAGGGGADLLDGGDGDDTITWNVGDGRDSVEGGAEATIGDTFVINGDDTAETFNIYSREEWVAAGNTSYSLNSTTEIVITRNGSEVAAELNDIEEIVINSAGGNDTFNTFGNFNNTSLWFNTITLNTGAGDDVVNVTGMTSNHHVVLNSQGGNDDFVGQRLQDEFNFDVNSSPTVFNLSPADLDGLLNLVSGVPDEENEPVVGFRDLSGFADGVANDHFIRLTDAHFGDNGAVNPLFANVDARNISNILGAQEADLAKAESGSNIFFMAFGQYFDHGLDFLAKGGNGKIFIDGQDSFGPMGQPANFVDLTRGTQIGTEADGTPIYRNTTSPFVDQNQAYGSVELVGEFLRESDGNGGFGSHLFHGVEDPGAPSFFLLPTLREIINHHVEEATVFSTGQTLVEAYPGLINGDGSINATVAGQLAGNFLGSGQNLLLDANRGISVLDHFIAGDGRVNENISLTAMHTVWARNHNFHVDNLEAAGFAGTTEELFQASKMLNEAEYQRVVFTEFADKLLGGMRGDGDHGRSEFNADTDPRISHEFAAAAYRIGHSLISDTLTVLDAAGNSVDVPLVQAFLNPGQYASLGAGSILGGIATQQAEAVDFNIVDAVRNDLVGTRADLFAFNVARGWDVGIGTMNQVRAGLAASTDPYVMEAISHAGDLSAYASWEDFQTRNGLSDAVIAQFQEAYPDLVIDAADIAAFTAANPDLILENGNTVKGIDRVDLWVGGLAEQHILGGHAGQTFWVILHEQFDRLQESDKFYYIDRFDNFDFYDGEFEDTGFAGIVARNTGLEGLPEDIFSAVAPETVEEEVIVEEEVVVEETIVNEVIGNDDINMVSGTSGDDLLLGLGGDDGLVGNGGDDVATGGTGNDTILTDSGDDIAFGGAGDDNIITRAGDDIIFGDEGDDRVLAGAGDDTITATANDGHDMYFGDAGNDTLDMSAIMSNIEANLGTGFQSSGYARSAGSNDTLSGIENIITGAGDDMIVASAAVNIIDGGTGEDVFVFNSATDANNDVIMNFEPGDKLDLGFMGTIQIVNGTTSAAGQVAISHEQIDGEQYTVLHGQVDDAGTEFTINIKGNHALTQSNFM